VTNIELFFDLVYVFAITQLSHHLLGNPTWEGAWQTLLLLALMLVSLVMSAAIPTAFALCGHGAARRGVATRVRARPGLVRRERLPVAAGRLLARAGP
jgi:low temperature requirement protein LtrA